jgi:hypothetical protein
MSSSIPVTVKHELRNAEPIGVTDVIALANIPQMSYRPSQRSQKINQILLIRRREAIKVVDDDIGLGVLIISIS